MKKKLPIAILLAVVILALILIVFIFKPFANSNNSSSQNNSSSADQNFVLSDYPSDKVPLYEDITISSMKYIVNEDSYNVYDDFFGEKRNYYNVVFYSDDDSGAIFDFYKSKMETVNETSLDDSTIEGMIGEYKISIANYGEDDFYLEVHLPTFSKINKYYSEYPELVEISDKWIEYENSYGLLNQKGGEIEYTQWFNVNTTMLPKDDPMKTDPIGEFYKIYKDKNKTKDSFNSDDQSGTLTWKDNSFNVTCVFSKDHGRVYLMFRKLM